MLRLKLKKYLIHFVSFHVLIVTAVKIIIHCSKKTTGVLFCRNYESLTVVLFTSYRNFSGYEKENAIFKEQ